MFRSSFAPYGRSRTLQVLFSFLVICTLLSTVRLYRRQPPPPSIYDYTDGKTRGAQQNDTSATRPLSDETLYLRYLVKKYGLTNEIPWFARRIRLQFAAKARKSMTEVSGSKFLYRDFQRVRTDDERLDLHAEKSVTLSVTKSATPDQVDASSLLFGISTSFDRLTYGNSSLIHDWARWLTDGKGVPNGASLVLTLHRATDSEVSHISSKLRSIGIDAIVLPAEEAQDSTARYLDLVHLLSRRKDELLTEEYEKKYLALVDDDVFFPSLGKLLSRLSKYSPRKKFYLGLPSEQADWTVENDVTLTYGGGVVFLTPPMADAVSKLPCLNTTAPSSAARAESKRGQWDAMLYTCIATHTSSQLHILPSLSTPLSPQTGAAYTSDVQPLTLHHYKQRHRFEAGKAHLLTSLCGEDCFLQRFFFRDDGWVLVAGHSISAYPDGVAIEPAPLTDRDPENKVGERLVLAAQPVPADRKLVSWAGAKRTWRLLDSRAGLDGAVWQAYVRHRGSAAAYADEDDRLPEDDTVHTLEGPADVDSVVVLIWER
ncbi:glycosyltransferase family 31 protein [Jackrogersella minutella]|nr:glycosyltransferase family 31 protein [Jackrogersella minutella]